MPDLLHVVPVGDDAVLDGVLERQDAALALGLVAHIAVLLAHANHDAHVPGPANNAGEHGPRGIITSKAGFHHARTRGE